MSRGIVAILVIVLLAIPSEAQEPESGKQQPWLGIWLSDAVDGGVQVVSLVPGGPASVADLREGDIIVKAGGDPVSDQTALGRSLGARHPGEALVLTVVRSGETFPAEVVLGRRPTPSGAASSVTAAPHGGWVSWIDAARKPLGIVVAEVTPDLRRHYGAPAGAGVLVTRVEAQGLASSAGVQVGDMLVQVGQQPIRSSAELGAAVARRIEVEPLRLMLIREKNSRVVTVEATLEGSEEGVAWTRTEGQRQLLSRRIEEKIKLLERRLAELRAELDRLDPDD